MAQNFIVEDVEISVRLTKWLQDKFSLSYASAQQLIRKSAVKVNGKKAKADCKMVNGDSITLYANLADGKQASMKPRDTKNYVQLLKVLQARVLVQDENILALNKPYGIATQGGTGVKVSIDDVLEGLALNSKIRPRLVHRLDKDTTGVLLIALNKRTAVALAEQFKENKVSKKYLALVGGNISHRSGTIRDKVAKAGETVENAKPALTRYRVLASSAKGVSLVEFLPLTGRTHQIRIHSAQSLCAPIVGDIKYGGKNTLQAVWLKKNLCLHSYETTLSLFGKTYHIKAPLPEHILEALAVAKITLPAGEDL